MAGPRHIIWITTDHMRYDCIGAHGNPAVHTPHLDRLVRGGVDFQGMYAQNPLCMPSRCSFMTGCYPAQTGILDNGQDLPADFPLTVARVMAPGYRPVQFGKLHFQSHENNDLDPRARHAYGFDLFNLAEEPGCYEDAYMTWLRGERPDLVETFRVPRPTSEERMQERTRYRVLDAPAEYSFSGWLASMAERHLGTWGGPREPQFIHMGFYAPHPPLNPTADMMAPYAGLPEQPLRRRAEEWADKPAPLAGILRGGRDLDEATLRSYRRHFHGMVTGVDLAVGRLLACLERTNLLDDTLIIFGSDHGDFCGDHGILGKNSAYYDEVVRLPLVLHWPRGLRQMAVGGLHEMVDVLPTLLGLAGLPVPRAMAGRDLSAALLAGEQPASRDEVYACHGAGEMMLRTERWKYLRWQRGAELGEVLYDLAADPEEFVNRAHDPALAGVLQQLRERLLHRHIEATRSIVPRPYRF